jgi:tRNA 2-thiouridine synthesizing protein C
MERLRWLSKAFELLSDWGDCQIFLTGDALFSLIDSRTGNIWRTIANDPGVRITVDGSELLLQGLIERIPSEFPSITISAPDDVQNLWHALITALIAARRGCDGIGFLLCHSPYMYRIPLFMLRCFAAICDAGLQPELYTYLDGVHVIHQGQKPSEFENIGEGLCDVPGHFAGTGNNFWFAACSRCASARGYLSLNPSTGFCEPSSCIDPVVLRPLKDIIGRLSGDHILISPMSGCLVGELHRPGEIQPPGLVIFITSPPYGTEWAFGGITFAITAAMKGIQTTVIFIEQGVYAVHGTHDLTEGQKIFNIQEIIASTMDVPALSYVVHAPSLDERGITISPQFSMIRQIPDHGLGTIVAEKGEGSSPHTAHLIFF